MVHTGRTGGRANVVAETAGFFGRKRRRKSAEQRAQSAQESDRLAEEIINPPVEVVQRAEYPTKTAGAPGAGDEGAVRIRLNPGAGEDLEVDPRDDSAKKKEKGLWGKAKEWAGRKRDEVLRWGGETAAAGGRWVGERIVAGAKSVGRGFKDIPKLPARGALLAMNIVEPLFIPLVGVGIGLDLFLGGGAILEGLGDVALSAGEIIFNLFEPLLGGGAFFVVLGTAAFAVWNVVNLRSFLNNKWSATKKWVKKYT